MKVLIFLFIFAMSVAADAASSDGDFCKEFGSSASGDEAFNTLSDAYGQAYQLLQFKRVLMRGIRSDYFFAVNRIDPRHLAAIQGDYDGFSKLMRDAEQPVLNSLKDRYDRTLLHYAALGGNLKIVRYLLRHGAHHVVFERFGMSPLHFAVAGGRPAIVDLLLRKGASLHRLDNNGASLMRQAAASGNLTMVRHLNGRGLSLLFEDFQKRNIYHYANPNALDLWAHLSKRRVGFKRPEFVEALLNAVADSDSPELASAVKTHSRDALPDLYATLLAKTVKKQRLTLLRFLLTEGVSVNSAKLKSFVRHMRFGGDTDDGALRENMYLNILKQMVSAGATPDASCLAQLCQRQHLDSAVWLMDQGVIPDASGLHCLAKTGNRAFVDKAILLGASPDTDTLHGAAESGNLTMLKALRQKYALPLNVRSSNNDSMLQSAIKSGNLDVVRYVVKHGVRPSVKQNRQRQNELHTLLYACDDKMVEYFSSEFSSEFSSNDYGLLFEKKLHTKETYRIAATHCPLNTSLRLLQTTDALTGLERINQIAGAVNIRLPNAFASVLETPKRFGPVVVAAAVIGRLAIATRDGDVVEMNDLMSRFPNIGKDASHPLIQSMATQLLIGAIGWDRPAVSCYAMANGANVNGVGKNGITPLIRAVQSGHLPLIKYLIANGADPNSTEYEFGTPLFIAARKENIDVFKYLLSHGALMKTRNELNAVFFEAAQNSHLDIVKYLVEERGADVNTTRYFGIFPLDTFQLYHDTERFFTVIDFALNHGLDLNRPAAGSIVHFLVKEYAEKPARTLALLKRFATRGASVNALNDSGQSPLFSAVDQSRVMRHKQFEKLGRFLLAHGANPSATDLSGQSILAHAESIRCSEEVISWLNKNGAQYSPSDSFSKAAESIFDDARWHKDNDAESIARLAKLLGQFKNHHHLTSKDGETLLHMASQSGRVALVKYLLENGFSATAVDSAHHTPLYHALTSAYSIEMARLLVANGAALPKDPDEAYSWIFSVLSNGRFDILTYLRSEGVELTAPDDAQYIDFIQRRLQPIFGMLTQMIAFQPSNSGELDCALYILNFYLNNGWDPFSLVDPQNQSLWKAILADSVSRCDTDMLQKLIDTFSRFGSFKRLCDTQTLQQAKQCSNKPIDKMLIRGHCPK